MKEPVSLLQVPHGGLWKYREPGTGVLIESNHHGDFLAKAFKHREANGLYTGGGWQADVWHNWCLQNPHCECKEVGVPERRMEPADIRRFAITMSNHIGNGMKYVTQEEAERRASICTTCPYNKALVGCWGCHGPLNWIMQMLSGRQTSKDAQLEGCEKCLCALRAKVHLPISVIDNEGVTDLPSFCWMKEGEVGEVGDS